MVENWDGPPTGYNWKQFLAKVKLFSFTRLDKRLCKKRNEHRIRTVIRLILYSVEKQSQKQMPQRGLQVRNEKRVGPCLMMLHLEERSRLSATCCLAGMWSQCSQIFTFYKKQEIHLFIWNLLIFILWLNLFKMLFRVKKNRSMGKRYLMSGSFEISMEQKLWYQTVLGLSPCSATCCVTNPFEVLVKCLSLNYY